MSQAQHENQEFQGGIRIEVQLSQKVADECISQNLSSLTHDLQQMLNMHGFHPQMVSVGFSQSSKNVQTGFCEKTEILKTLGCGEDFFDNY